MDMNTEHPLIKELRGVRRVVINDCHGGFGLSEDAITRYMELTGQIERDFHHRDIPRDDPYLVQVVRELGDLASGCHAKLKIVEIPGDVSWHIAEYDGSEWVAEDHRTWS
jgi:hypothetical protein